MSDRSDSGRFSKGNKAAKGGTRPNSGRKPGEVKQLERELVHDQESLVRAWSRLEQLVEEGNLDAIKYRIDRALGKPGMTINTPSSGSFRLVIMPPRTAT